MVGIDLHVEGYAYKLTSGYVCVCVCVFQGNRTVAALPSSSSRPPLPPLMERVRKIKRQLSMTLRGGNSSDKNLTESISSQDTGAHSDSGTVPRPHL